LYHALQAAGYHIWYEVINALNLGIPQDRPRLALVGFKKSIIRKLLKEGYKLLLEKPDDNTEELIFKWPKKKFEKPKDIEWPGIWEFGSNIVRNEVSKIPDEYKCLTVSHAFNGLNDNTPNQKEQFEPYSEKFKTIWEGDTSGKSFKRLHRYRYSPTVAYGNNEVHLHPTKKRRLSVREALRLQTVPDTYILPADMGLSPKFKLISNGVPVKKADLIAKEIRRTLEIFENIR
jgi:DNA (cytosine-5)-methyltransferase 1